MLRLSCSACWLAGHVKHQQPSRLFCSDNLAVAHEAHPSTQLPVSQVGLRVMHRCTIAGMHEPAKE